jgi:hypothetical protein
MARGGPLHGSAGERSVSLPLCTTELGPGWIDGGTLCRTRSNAPGPIGLDADAGTPMDGGAANKRPANPPPVTRTSTSSVKKESGADVDIDVTVEVVADAADSTLPAGTAETTFDNGLRVVIPPTAWIERDGKKIVTRLTTPFSVKGLITVHTRYGTGAMATVPSGYGRGTTEEDIKAGDTTLGFHESCHRADLLGYLSARPLPVFTGKVGMTVGEFERAGAEFRASLNDYFVQMQKQSDLKTDEVGYTKSSYLKFGPRIVP